MRQPRELNGVGELDPRAMGDADWVGRLRVYYAVATTMDEAWQNVGLSDWLEVAREFKR